MHVAPQGGWVATSFRSLPSVGLVRAERIEQAVAALADHPDAAVLSGGTDFPARFNEGRFPGMLVDISRLDGLRGIRRVADTLVIGAATTHAQGSGDPLLRATLPGLAQAWRMIANVRVRFSATIGGNLMARRTRYEGAILLTALSARLVFATPRGPATMPVEDIWTQGTPAAGLLRDIVIPLTPGLRFDYERSMRPMFTQAVAIDDAGAGRVVSATEYVVPRVQPWSADLPARYVPGAFNDPVTGDAYLNQVAPVFLRRQVARMGAA